ncbi:MAG: tetratricopeptide repeat protein [Pseudomonadota bacterium]|nr:tetratricopeptide repeat protein [Pseudomonadota bacterium]
MFVGSRNCFLALILSLLLAMPALQTARAVVRDTAGAAGSDTAGAGGGDAGLCDRSGADPDAGIPACTRLLEPPSPGTNVPAVYNNRGVAKVRKGDLGGAVMDFTSALNRNPNYADAFKNRGIVRHMQGDYDEAIADFNRALRLDPRSPDLYNARGAALCQREEYDRAIADFNKAIALDPNYKKAFVNRGLAFHSERQLNRAIADFNEFVRLAPNELIGYTDRAAVRMDRGEFKGAMADYNEAIRLDPKNSGVYTRRGEAWRLQGDLERSLADHNQAIDLNPNDDEAYNNRALALKDQGKLAKAIADCDEAILLNPKSYLAYTSRGMIRRLNGNLAGSLTDLDKAVGLNPRSPVALTFRGDTLRELGDNDRAMKDFNEAIRIRPDFVAAYTGRGLSYEQKGDLPKAKADFEKAQGLSADLDAGLARPAQDVARARLAALAAEEAARGKEVAERAAKEASEAHAKAEADARAKAESEAKAKTEVEARVKAEGEARARRTALAAEEAARAKEAAERAPKEATGPLAKAEDARNKSVIEQQMAAIESKLDLLTKKTAEAAAAAQAASEARKSAAANEWEKAEADARAKAEVEDRVKAEAEARAKAAAEARAKAEAEARIPVDIQQALQHRGHALLIGVSDYTSGWPGLPNVKDDLNDLKGALKLYFETVDELLNPTVEQLRNQIREFLLGQWNTSDARLFIYYAGHGFPGFNRTSHHNEGYITGSDTPLQTTGRAAFNAVAFTDIIGWNRESLAQHVLTVFDSCFSGSLFQTKADTEPDQKNFEAVRTLIHKPVRYFITAGRQNEEVSAESTFARLLVKGLSGAADKYNVGVVGADDLGNYLYHTVPNESQRPQTPQHNNIGIPYELSEGQFFFLTRPAATGTSAPLVAPIDMTPMGTTPNWPGKKNNKSRNK